MHQNLRHLSIEKKNSKQNQINQLFSDFQILLIGEEESLGKNLIKDEKVENQNQQLLIEGLWLGFFMFMVNLKIEKCGKGIVADYLVLYFVQLGYLGMIVVSMLIIIIAKICKQNGTPQQTTNEPAVKNDKNNRPEVNESSNNIFIQASQIKDSNSQFNIPQQNASIQDLN